jgi:hypothetical protein
MAAAAQTAVFSLAADLAAAEYPRDLTELPVFYANAAEMLGELVAALQDAATQIGRPLLHSRLSRELRHRGRTAFNDWFANRTEWLELASVVHMNDILELSYNQDFRHMRPCLSLSTFSAAVLAFHASALLAPDLQDPQALLQASLAEWRQQYVEVADEVAMDLLGAAKQPFRDGFTLVEFCDLLSSLRFYWNRILTVQHLSAIVDLLELCLYPMCRELATSMMRSEWETLEDADVALAQCAEIEMVYFHLLRPGRVLQRLRTPEVIDLLRAANLDQVDLSVYSQALVSYTRSRTGPEDASYALSNFYADLQMAALPPATLEWEARKRNRHMKILHPYNICDNAPSYRRWIQADLHEMLDAPKGDFARSQLLVRFACELLSSTTGHEIYDRYVISDAETTRAAALERIAHDRFLLLNVGQVYVLVLSGAMLVGPTEHLLAAFCVLVVRLPVYAEKRHVFENVIRTFTGVQRTEGELVRQKAGPAGAADAAPIDDEQTDLTLRALIEQISEDLRV